jgi:hypothetical protein
VAAHEVAQLASGSKRLRHQVLGEMTFTHVVLTRLTTPSKSS